MASSCNNNRPQHEDDDQHPQWLRLHRFFASGRRSRMQYFHNNSLLVMFVAFALLIFHHPVAPEELTDNTDTTTEEYVVLSTTIPPLSTPHFINSPHFDENEDSNVESRNLTNIVKTHTTENLPLVNVENLNTPSIHTTVHNLNEAESRTLYEDHVSTSDKPIDMEQPDVNNEIFSTMVEVNPVVQAPHVNSEQSAKEAESTENLEESIRNSVKTEMEKGLEPSPVLEILKDISEPEIRETLKEDLIEPTLNQNDISPKLDADDDQNENITHKDDETKHKSEDDEKVKDPSQNEAQVPPEVADDVEYESDAADEIRGEVTEITEDLHLGNGETMMENNRGARNLDKEDIHESKQGSGESSASSSESNSSDFSHQAKPEVGIENRSALSEEEHTSNQLEIEETSNPSIVDNQEPRDEEENENESDIGDINIGNGKRNEEVNRGARNLENEQTPEESSASSSESNSSDSSNEAQARVEHENVSELTDEQNANSNILADQESKSKETEVDLTIPETSEEVHESATTHATDIAILDENEAENNEYKQSAEEDEALSVVLDESLASTVPNNEDDTLLTAEQKEQKTSLDIIAEEETTSIPEETEHVVIKKVLDENEIYAEVPETTVLPREHDVDQQQPGIIIEVPNPTIIEETMPIASANEVQEDNPKVSPHNEINLSENIPKTISEDSNENQEGKSVNENQSEEQSNENVQSNMETVTSENPSNADQMSQASDDVDVDSEEEYKKDTSDENENDSAEENDDDAHKNQIPSSSTESLPIINPETTTYLNEQYSKELNFLSTTESLSQNREEYDISKTLKGSRSVNTALMDDDTVATMFDSYPPQDAGQTFNGNLADESAGIGKALPVSNSNSSNKSTAIIILSSGIAVLFIVISVTIFLISFQRQHGTLDIEMQERSCGKDNLDEEDAETFAKLLEVELPPSVAIALEETEECL
ncbi:dpp target gene [Haematobia irritans]|uniref:dpp target gene n=1 Tax=Haematobia irritans TaxID=7368 RepID=UPI003F4FE604